jgi:hypothetical protein
MLAILTMGGLYFLISNLTPEAIEARRQEKTNEALSLARDALLGYVLKYRDEETAQGRRDRMYGYLPLPDLGSSRNGNAGCTLEGCDANTFTGIAYDPNGIIPTVVGRFPWRTLGTGPLRDGHGECLWLIVSSLHTRIHSPAPNLPPMNWDTLGQLDIVTAKGTNELTSALAAHDRPIAIIFSPGHPLGTQDRSNLGANDVSECGGNYNAANYLDPATAAALGGVTNYLAGANNASDMTGDSDTSNDPDPSNDLDDKPKRLLVQGKVFKSGANYLPGGCSAGNCELLANDVGLPITSELLFGALRKSSNFRVDINAMLERMATCLRDSIAAGNAIAPAKIGSDTCYDGTKNPQGYFNHYRDQIFASSGAFSGTLDNVSGTNCAGVLVLGGQRAAGQQRVTVADKADAANYLEAPNVSIFNGSNGLAFAGPSQFVAVSPTQSANQDIVRCIPAGASLTVVAAPVATDSGTIRLASYAPDTRLLTLGSAADSSSYGAASAALYACAWTPEIQAAGSGLRSYFRFRIRRVGEGFTFAIIDGDRNGADACGAARQHLGYSGNNGTTPYIAWPKLAIEFDTSRQCNSSTFDTTGRPACFFTESGDTLRNGRNDPCYTTSCWEDSPLYPGIKQSLDNSSHVAVVYWGYGSALSQQSQDDNVHDQPGMPMPLDPSSRPGPRNPAPVLPYVSNPATIPGIAPLDRMGSTDASQREFHARIEITRGFNAPVDAKDGVTSVLVNFWIEPQSAKSISAMTYNPGSPPTLTVTAVGHGLATGDTVVIQDAVPTGYNGEYAITKIDADQFIANLPATKTNPGPYISSITWLNVDWTTDQATVTSANHGLVTGNSVVISGAFPTEFNGTHAIIRIDDNTYRFGLELPGHPGSMVPAIAAAKALTPRALALANTTRPMSTLDATFKPLVSNTATIYDEQKGACAPSGQACPNGQSCGSDHMCYRPSFRNLRLGFTTAERPTSNNSTARGQHIEVSDRATTWLP